MFILECTPVGCSKDFLMYDNRISERRTEVILRINFDQKARLQHAKRKSEK